MVSIARTLFTSLWKRIRSDLRRLSDKDSIKNFKASIIVGYDGMYILVTAIEDKLSKVLLDALDYCGILFGGGIEDG